ncbi:MAG: class I SAM-dependent DNA methyltransferase [Cyclobacteriaceae bacterium]
MLTKELKNKVQSLWDKFWSGGIANPLQAIEQITYLLFMKQLDELDRDRQKENGYKSIFQGNYIPPGADRESEGIEKETLRWSSFKTLPADDMLRHIQTLVFPFIKTIGDANSHFVKHMDNAVFIIPKSSLLLEAVKTIDEIYDDLKAENRFIDAQGDFYEYLLNQLSGAGKNGQFRTPTHIIEMIVELVEPQIEHKIADPACGSAGFLLGAYKYIVSQYSSDKEKDENGFIRGSSPDLLKDKKLKKKLESETFYGFDIDSTMIRIGLMNLMMHGIKEPKIEYKDTLSKGYNEDGVYDIIIANPPFTGSVDKEDINETFELDTTKSELLFLERIYKMLRIGGTAGVVIPQGVLFGSSNVFKQAREILVNRCELKAVISMPSGFFRPYTGVATAVLVFTKGGETENVWFYDMLSDGYSLGDKRNELYTKEDKRDFGDLHKVIEEFKNPKKNTDRKKRSFLIPKKEIVTKGFDLSFNKYFIEVFIEKEYEEPKKIIEKLDQIEADILSGIKELKGIFK